MRIPVFLLAVAAIGVTLADHLEDSESDSDSETYVGARHLRFAAGDEFQLNSVTANDQFGPDAVALSSDRFVAAWSSQNGDASLGDDVHLQVFEADGSAVGAEVVINTFKTQDQERPSLARLDDERFVVVYESFGQDGAHDGVFARILTHSGALVGSEFQVNTYNVSHQWYPSVAVFDGGAFLVAWESEGQRGDASGLYNQCFDRDGNRIGEEFFMLEHSNGINAAPRVTALGSDKFVLTWSDAETVWFQVYSIYGEVLVPKTRANTFTAYEQIIPDVAALCDSRFVIVWNSHSQDPSGWGVYGQVFDVSGSHIGGEFQANTETYHHQMQPTVSALGDGSFVVSWQSLLQDGSSWGVFAQLFCRGGHKVGTEFQVNQGSFLQQVRPAIASHNGQWFVVVWEGEGSEVYGRAFVADPEHRKRGGDDDDKLSPGIVAGIVGGCVGVAAAAAFCCVPPRRRNRTPPVSEAIPAVRRVTTTADGEGVVVVVSTPAVPPPVK